LADHLLEYVSETDRVQIVHRAAPERHQPGPDLPIDGLGLVADKVLLELTGYLMDAILVQPGHPLEHRVQGVVIR
jgi:hypothetical protein